MNDDNWNANVSENGCEFDDVDDSNASTIETEIDDDMVNESRSENHIENDEDDNDYETMSGWYDHCGVCFDGVDQPL